MCEVRLMQLARILPGLLQFAAYGQEEGALLAKHPLYEAWLEQAGLMPEDIGRPTAAAPAAPAQ